MNQKYPFYRKYPNGYLEFIGVYELEEMNVGRILQKFKILKTQKKIANDIWTNPAIIVVPIKENPEWRNKFRMINKILSSNYIYWMMPTRQQIIDFGKEIRKLGQITRGKRYVEEEFKMKLTGLIPQFQKIGKQDLADKCQEYYDAGMTNTIDFLWELRIEEQYGEEFNKLEKDLGNGW